MVTPYDWQEGIGNRAQYIEGRLKRGTPVLAVSLDEGILLYTEGRGARKIFEIYDLIIMGALGQQSDVDALRTAAVDFAHREGYTRSQVDVTLQRVATAISAPMKRAFADFGVVPIVAKVLFAEVGDSPENDVFYALDYDGDFSRSRLRAAVSGTEAEAATALKALEDVPDKTKPKDAIKLLAKIWADCIKERSEEEEVQETTPESVLLSRSSDREDRFYVLERTEQ